MSSGPLHIKWCSLSLIILFPWSEWQWFGIEPASLNGWLSAIRVSDTPVLVRVSESFVLFLSLHLFLITGRIDVPTFRFAFIDKRADLHACTVVTDDTKVRCVGLSGIWQRSGKQLYSPPQSRMFALSVASLGSSTGKAGYGEGYWWDFGSLGWLFRPCLLTVHLHCF